MGLREWNECPQCGSESVGGNRCEINHCNACHKFLWNTKDRCHWCKSTDIKHDPARPMTCGDCDWEGDPYDSLCEEYVEDEVDGDEENE